jgi:4-diphosphocytidyl-2C-methyl-D-erythritol kinase
MSGSGSCYYLLTGKDNSQKLYEKMKSEFSDCFISLVDFI